MDLLLPMPSEELRKKLLMEEMKLRKKQPEHWAKTKYRKYAKPAKAPPAERIYAEEPHEEEKRIRKAVSAKKKSFNKSAKKAKNRKQSRKKASVKKSAKKKR
jgi:hypothetical protein